MMVTVGSEPTMAETAQFPMGAVNSSLKQLYRPEIIEMDITELRAKLKQALPFGYVDAATPQDIDEMDAEAAREALDEACQRARTRSA